MRKGQVSVIGFLLITAMALVIIGTTYFWAVPMIEKARNQDEIYRLENRFLETHAAIKKVANERTQLTVPFNIKKGLLILDADDNRLFYKANLKLPTAFKKRVLIGNETELGILGQDEPGYLVERASIELYLKYVLLNDTSTGKCYGIKLEPGPQAAIGAGDHRLFLRWMAENTTTTYSGCADVTLQIIRVDME